MVYVYRLVSTQPSTPYYKPRNTITTKQAATRQQQHLITLNNIIRRHRISWSSRGAASTPYCGFRVIYHGFASSLTFLPAKKEAGELTASSTKMPPRVSGTKQRRPAKAERSKLLNARNTKKYAALRMQCRALRLAPPVSFGPSSLFLFTASVQIVRWLQRWCACFLFIVFQLRRASTQYVVFYFQGPEAQETGTI